jgi:hypothetical protein
VQLTHERLPRSHVGDARLHADTVADLEVGDVLADLRDNARGLVSEDHRLVQDERADRAVLCGCVCVWGGRGGQ